MTEVVDAVFNKPMCDDQSHFDRHLSSPRRYGFGTALKLHGAVAFGKVFAGKTRHSAGPLAVWAIPNGLPYSRLGLSVSRMVGTAVRRNHIKRMLREAFRLWQHDLPAGYDWVVVVYKHEPRTLEEYQRLLKKATEQLHATWQRRSGAGG